MPIRRVAAEKLARDLFKAYLNQGLISETMMPSVADIIQSAVNIDETECRIADMQARMAIDKARA
jgi:hypothetical protein